MNERAQEHFEEPHLAVQRDLIDDHRIDFQQRGRAGKWQDYRDGSEIILEGELDDSFYIIVHGEVAVRKLSKDLRALYAGDCFGEMGYLAKTKRTATIVARGPTSLLKVNSVVINQVSLNCQVRFLKVFLRTLIHRLSVTTEKMSQEA